MAIDIKKYLEDSFTKDMIKSEPLGELANSFSTVYLNALLNEVKKTIKNHDINRSTIKLTESVSLNAFHQIPENDSQPVNIYFYIGAFQSTKLLLDAYLSISSKLIFLHSNNTESKISTLVNEKKSKGQP